MRDPQPIRNSDSRQLRTCEVCGRPYHSSKPSRPSRFCSFDCFRASFGSRDDRFDAKILRVPSDCWEWQAFRNPAGYGVFQMASYESVLAHRFAYERVHGPIPPGLVLDHLCRNRCCVNPDHLEAVTEAENTYRGMATGSIARRTDQCMRGHPLSGDNLYQPPGRPNKRVCRICKRERDLKRYERSA